MAKAASPNLAGARADQDRDVVRWPSLGTAALIYFVLSLLYFLPALLPGRQVFGTDYLGGGYMFYHFIGERLGTGELPKWVPYVYGGMPLAANPGSTYHPVHFLADVVLPTSKVLTVVFLVHFFFAGLGMYLLALELGCRRWVAFIGGLAFQFTGITMSWVYAGHDGRIMVATMAPLFFYFLHRGIRTGRLAPFAGASATIGLALLSFQIQNSYYLLLAAAIWAVFALVHLKVARRPADLAKTVGLGLGAVAVGFLIASVNFLPFLDYVPESPRGAGEGRGYEFSTSFSMPEGEILSLAVPEHHGVSVYDPEAQQPLFPEYRGENGFKLHTEYVGAFVLVLLALGFYYSRRDPYWWFFLGLSVFALTIALGGNTPIYRLYYEILPGTKQFRAPSLVFFVVSLSLVSMAVLTLERLARLREGIEGTRSSASSEGDRLSLVPALAGSVAILALLGAAMAGGASSAPGMPSAAQGWIRFAFFGALVAGAVWLWVARHISVPAAALALALVTLADLWVVDRKFFHTVPGPEEMFAADDVVTFLESQPGEHRIWTFPYPQPWRSGGPNGGNYPMMFGLDQVGGEHPNPLQNWVAYLGAGQQTYTDWHNFVAQAEVVNTSAGQAIAFGSTPGFLEAANVRYIVSMAPLANPALREVHRGSALVYENTQALPRAYLVPSVQPVAGEMIDAMRARPWNPQQVAFVEQAAGVTLPGGPLQGTAEVVEYTPDRVVVRTTSNRPALLVLADNFYQGWVATVGGTETPIVRTNNTFRGVRVPEGTHEVVFEFRPTDLYTGLGITISAMLSLIGYGVLLLLRGNRQRGVAAPVA